MVLCTLHPDLWSIVGEYLDTEEVKLLLSIDHRLRTTVHKHLHVIIVNNSKYESKEKYVTPETMNRFSKWLDLFRCIYVININEPLIIEARDFLDFLRSLTHTISLSTKFDIRNMTFQLCQDIGEAVSSSNLDTVYVYYDSAVQFTGMVEIIPCGLQELVFETLPAGRILPPNLTTLVINTYAGPENSEILPESLSYLRINSFSNLPALPPDLKSLTVYTLSYAQSQRLPPLLKLKVDFLPVDDGEEDDLISLIVRALPRTLKYLNINKRIPEKSLLDLPQQLLYLHYYDISGTVSGILQKLPPSLTHLEVCGVITNMIVQDFYLNGEYIFPRHLQILNLSFNDYVTTETLKALPQTLTDLTMVVNPYIDVSYLPVNLEALTIICVDIDEVPFAKLPQKLQRLECRDVNHINTFRGLPLHLRSLCIRLVMQICNVVTDAMLAELPQYLRNLEIHHFCETCEYYCSHTCSLRFEHLRNLPSYLKTLTFCSVDLPDFFDLPKGLEKLHITNRQVNLLSLEFPKLREVNGDILSSLSSYRDAKFQEY